MKLMLSLYGRGQNFGPTHFGMVIPFWVSSSVDKMLASNGKPATARKYSRIWDKWVAVQISAVW
jgi:hypothetical protein